MNVELPPTKNWKPNSESAFTIDRIVAPLSINVETIDVKTF